MDDELTHFKFRLKLCGPLPLPSAIILLKEIYDIQEFDARKKLWELLDQDVLQLNTNFTVSVYSNNSVTITRLFY